MTRYEAQGPETEFEPGSRQRVLRNLLGIRSVREMQSVESDALLVATGRLIDETAEDGRFTAADICHFHRAWLGEIYSWAGEYRGVNISKGGFPFAPPDRFLGSWKNFRGEPCADSRPATQT